MTAGWLLQHLLPKDTISATIYRVARSERPWLTRPLIGWFARTYHVDLSQAEQPELDSYRTFNAFFTRALRAGARPLAGDRETVVSPADGTLTQFGSIDADTLLQAKGRHYSLAALLGEDGAAVNELRGGSYCTIYLAPHDYHRVHAPLGGALERTRYIPGRRFSVSRATAAAIDRIFCRNERVVCWFETRGRTDGRRARRRAQRIQCQHVQPRRDRERRTAALAGEAAGADRRGAPR